MEVKHVSSLTDRIARMGAEAAKRKSQSVSPPEEVPPAKIETAKLIEILPIIYDISARDSRWMMDVAPFRLSKKDLRPNATIIYNLPGGTITVTSGPYGMASVWDYDIVLMAFAQLTEAMNRFREGKGPKPSPYFRPHVKEILKFCRRENGGKQKELISGALDRLASTYVTIERKGKFRNKAVTINEGENLIAWKKVIANNETGRVEFVEFKVADWMYREITEGAAPDVLSVHPDYFLIEHGIGRFVYRLARRTAGKTIASWGFRKIFERSGSTGTFKEFCRRLRMIIELGGFPEYTLSEDKGQIGPLLVMTYQGAS
jgi:plasmid replication initiation protein